MDPEHRRTASITGATSFVGRHLVRALLERGWTVHALARPSPTPRWSLAAPGLVWHAYDGSLESVETAVAAGRPQVAIHLASVFRAEHQSSDITPLIEANLLLGTQLAEALVRHDCRLLVNTGTAWQHFQDRPYDPVNLYAATKQALQDILEYFVQAKQLRVITLKLYDTYGPEDDRPKILRLLQDAAATGKELALSPGEQRLNMVYIDDVSAAFLQATDRLMSGRCGGQESYAVAAAETVSLRELVGLVQEVLGRPIAARWGIRPYRAREVMVPWKGPTLPDWSCRISLQEGLRRTLCMNSVPSP
jgi:nucleoside-diphosphate-sugar epimerase